MNRARVHAREDALVAHVDDEVWIDWRDAAEDAREAGALAGDRVPRHADHRRVHAPILVDLEIPMRFVVRLVPQLHRFDHESRSQVEMLCLDALDFDVRHESRRGLLRLPAQQPHRLSIAVQRPHVHIRAASANA